MITNFSFDINVFRFETSTMKATLNLDTGELVYERKGNKMTGNEMVSFLNKKYEKKAEPKIAPNAFDDDSDSDSDNPDISDVESLPDQIYHAPKK